MPIQRSVNAADHRLTFVFDGQVTADEVIAVRRAQAEAGQWRYTSLVDTRKSPSVPSSVALRRIEAFIAAMSDRYGPIGRIAMVVSTDVGYGMGRMFEAIAMPVDFAVFRNVEDAEAWLNAAPSTEPSTRHNVDYRSGS